MPERATCVCGNPLALNTVHRADGPCYQAERDDTGAEAILEAHNDGVMYSAAVIVNLFDQPVIAARLLKEAGLHSINLSALDEYEREHLVGLKTEGIQFYHEPKAAIRVLPLPAVHEQETEIELLRVVYEHARSFLRFNGTDKDRMNRAVDAMDEAVENVKQFDGGAFEKEVEQPTGINGLSEAESLLPHAYLLAKLAMVMPLFQECRDALTVVTEQQRVSSGISKTLADRMDIAGTFSLDDWKSDATKKGAAA